MVKKRIRYFIVLSTLFLVLTSCQKSPNHENYYNQVEKKGSINLPDYVNAEIENIGKNMQIIISADVVFPKNTTLFKAKIEPLNFHKNEVDILLEGIFGVGDYKLDDRLDGLRERANLFETAQFDNPLCPDKEWYTEILELISKGGIGDQNSRLEELRKENSAEYERVVSLVRDPDDNTQLLLNEKWISISQNKWGFPFFSCNNQNTKLAEVQFITERGIDSYDENGNIVDEYITISKEDAVETANDFLEKMKINQYTFSGQIVPYSLDDSIVEDGKQDYYRVHFIKEIDGLFVNYHWLYHTGDTLPDDFQKLSEEEISNISEEKYAPTWNHNSLYVDVDSNGIREFFYNSPFDVTEKSILNYEDDLKSFSDVFNTAISGITVKNILIPHFHNGNEEHFSTNENSINNQIFISEIKFGLCRVPVKNRIGEYELVPAWDFIGTQKAYNHDIDDFEIIYDLYSGDRKCFITINALDLSIISREYGG